ncbi:hypothetical protein NL676_021369 [Syzygium grande]|nr:hypothetical protein NL676_021369 [Syzygium grande]
MACEVRRRSGSNCIVLTYCWKNTHNSHRGNPSAQQQTSVEVALALHHDNDSTELPRLRMVSEFFNRPVVFVSPAWINSLRRTSNASNFSNGINGGSGGGHGSQPSLAKLRRRPAWGLGRRRSSLVARREGRSSENRETGATERRPESSLSGVLRPKPGP